MDSRICVKARENYLEKKKTLPGANKKTFKHQDLEDFVPEFLGNGELRRDEG